MTSLSLVSPELQVEIRQMGERIAELKEALDDFQIHCVPGPADDWMMIPKVEFEKVVERLK